VTPLAKVLVRSDAAALDVGYGATARDEHGTLIVGAAPGEWLLIGSVGEAEAIAGRIPTQGFTVVLDYTHVRALVRLTGADTTTMLAKVCAIDLADHMAPDGAAFRAPVAAVVTDVVRDDHEGTRSYLLHCERSSGRYLFEALLDAGAEFGITVAGFHAGS
jgi:heterotetrameric sarcosine oxidase gamma subunit